MKTIPLTKGYVAFVDDDDYERVSRFSWRVSLRSKSAYAIRTDKTYKTQYLHRFILNAPTGQDVDHIDGNGLMCCRANLRLCDHKENQRNRRKNKNNRSGFKGVKWNGVSWVATIGIGGQDIYLGSFDTAQSAALAYQKAAQEYHGEFANPGIL